VTTAGIHRRNPAGTAPLRLSSFAFAARLLCILLLFFTGFPAAAQDSTQDQTQDTGQEAAAGPPSPSSGEDGKGDFEPLAKGFNNILLGMGMEAVKEELKRDPNFRFRGDPDVSMMRTPNTSLIECRGYYYVERASFQFIDDSLYTITIILEAKKMGHYAMFTALSEKYGEPDSLSPEKSIWENDELIISLERPLRVKYMAKEILEELMREQRKKKSVETISRERFLEQF
jgi:hypothetical protein